MKQKINKDTATEIFELLTHADGTCPHCAGDLFWRFITLYPEYKTLGIEIFYKTYNRDLEDFNYDN